jgi:hypothetical protein
MKVKGKLGMALGVAVGYVLGARAGRERYEQMAASAHEMMDKPQVKRVIESAPETARARVEQLANKAADAVHQAADRVAPNDAAAPPATASDARPAASDAPAAASDAPATGRTSKGRSKSS